MKVDYVHKDTTTDENIRKEFSDVIYPTMVIRSQTETIELQKEEIERLNNAFDSLEQIIRYYVIDNVKYDNNTAEYILERLLMFWGKDSDK